MNFQGRKYSSAPIYLKISTKEGGIFSACLILGVMSTMLRRGIFDIRANYVAKFVKIRLITNTPGGKCTFASNYFKITAKEGEIFSACLIL